MSSYAIRNLRDLEDAAAQHGLGEMGESRFGRTELGAEATGFAYHVLRPGKAQPFAHRHEQAEEVHVVLSGSGVARLDDEEVALRPLDTLRVAPAVTRSFQAGSEGLELLVFGPHHAGAGEMIPPPSG